MLRTSLLLIAISAIGGCTNTVVIKRNFPDPVPELMKKCEDLKIIQSESSVPITEMLKVVIENYQLYYMCANKVETWQLWYNDQKEIFDSVK